MKIGMYEAFRRSAQPLGVPAIPESPHLHREKSFRGIHVPQHFQPHAHHARPDRFDLPRRACERSMMRLSTNGPRSVMRTIVDLLLLRFVTRTMVSNGNVRCAAVSLFIS